MLLYYRLCNKKIIFSNRICILATNKFHTCSLNNYSDKNSKKGSEEKNSLSAEDVEENETKSKIDLNISSSGGSKQGEDVAKKLKRLEKLKAFSFVAPTASTKSSSEKRQSLINLDTRTNPASKEDKEEPAIETKLDSFSNFTFKKKDSTARPVSLSTGSIEKTLKTLTSLSTPKLKEKISKYQSESAGLTMKLAKLIDSKNPEKTAKILVQPLKNIASLRDKISLDLENKIRLAKEKHASEQKSVEQESRIAESQKAEKEQKFAYFSFYFLFFVFVTHNPKQFGCYDNQKLIFNFK